MKLNPTKTKIWKILPNYKLKIRSKFTTWAGNFHSSSTKARFANPSCGPNPHTKLSAIYEAALLGCQEQPSVNGLVAKQSWRALPYTLHTGEWPGIKLIVNPAKVIVCAAVVLGKWALQFSQRNTQLSCIEKQQIATLRSCTMLCCGS